MIYDYFICGLLCTQLHVDILNYIYMYYHLYMYVHVILRSYLYRVSL